MMTSCIKGEKTCALGSHSGRPASPGNVYQCSICSLLVDNGSHHGQLECWSHFGRLATHRKVLHYSKFSPSVYNGSHCGWLASQSIKNGFVTLSRLTDVQWLEFHHWSLILDKDGPNLKICLCRDLTLLLSVT